MSQSKKNLQYKIPFPDTVSHTAFIARRKNTTSVAYSEPDEVTQFIMDYPSVYEAFASEQRRNLIDFIRTYRKNHERWKVHTQ